jgi:LysM repeat protein
MTDTAVPGFAASATTPDTGAVCPYLLAASGEWRSSSASRDHRCHAVAPAAALTTEKQRRLCLVDEHTGCSTYRAATALLEEAHSPAAAPRPLHRPVTKTAPLVLDRGRIALTVPGFPSLSERGIGQGGLVAVMVVAFGALVVARLGDAGPGLVPGGAGSEATPRPTTVATAPAGATDAPASADPVPERTLVPTEVEATPAPTAEPTPDGQATQQPTPRPTRDAPSTYTVKSGDTLAGIASVYGTTWQELAELNGIDDPRRLRVGQELQLP